MTCYTNLIAIALALAAMVSQFSALELPGSINGAISSIEGSMPSMPSMNMPDVDTPSMPNINMPDIDMPSMPDINMPSMPDINMPSMPSMPDMSMPSMPSMSMPSMPSLSGMMRSITRTINNMI